jgi:hypothetical protein
LAAICFLERAHLRARPDWQEHAFDHDAGRQRPLFAVIIYLVGRPRDHVDLPALHDSKSGLEFCATSSWSRRSVYSVVFGHITNYVTYFEHRTGAFVLFNIFGSGSLERLLYDHADRATGREWLAALGCGGAGFLARLFIFTWLCVDEQPALNWGYPRTVGGFFHAFTRGQYEKIHPTTNPVTFVKQIGMYIGARLRKFNLIYLLVAFVPLFFYRRMQQREKAWMLGIGAIYLCLSLFLLALLNPAPDKAEPRSQQGAFSTASHVMLAMSIGYGLTLISASLLTQYERYRKWVLIGLRCRVPHCCLRSV